MTFAPAADTKFNIRRINTDDDAAMAVIIRTVMSEFGAIGAGYSINDPEVDFISRAYAQPRCAYFVLERNGAVVGGSGIAPLAGGDLQTCELRKMYFLPQARGLGAGSAMIRRCLDAARGQGYRRCYLETLSSMSGASRLYERSGFTPVASPLGETGHSSCDRWYLLQFG